MTPLEDAVLKQFRKLFPRECELLLRAAGLDALKAENAALRAELAKAAERAKPAKKAKARDD